MMSFVHCTICSSTLTFISCSVAAFLVWFIVSYLKKPQKKSHPLVYYHKGFPIIGSLFDFTPGAFLKTAIDYPKKYGDIVQYNLLGKTGWLITDLALAKEIWSKRPKFFRRMRSLEYGAEVLDTKRGLFQSNGVVWQHVRKTTAPFFSHQNVMNKFDKIVEEMFCWIERLDQESNIIPTEDKINAASETSPSADVSPSSNIVDMKFQAFSLTIRVITIVAFGLSTNDPISLYFFSSQFMKDMEACFRFSIESALFFLPRWSWKWFPDKLQFENSAKNAINRMTTAAQGIIDYKRAMIKKEGASYAGTSMLDSLLIRADEEKEKALSDEDIMAQIKISYFAGSDTTAVVISWISYFFAINPVLRGEVRAEAEKMIFLSENGKRKTRKEITSSLSAEIISKLSLTSVCVKEVLRLCGPASTDGNQTASEGEPVTLSNGVIIEPHDIVFVNMDGIHMCDKVIDDPFSFNPKRWLVEDENKLRALESHFVPFGYGPRICPGMQLALYEAALATAFLAYFYDISLACSNDEIVRVRSFTAAPNKMPILLSKANDIKK
jgi:cytochrome P450